MRRLLCTYAMLCLISSGAVTALAAGQPEALTLLPGNEKGLPTFRVSGEHEGSFTVEIEIPVIHQEEVLIGGERYLQLAIPGGGYRGELGQASLPTITRLVAVPDNLDVQARVLEAEKRTFSGLKLAPLQSEKDESFVRDEAYFSRQGLDATPAVMVGEPAIMGNLRVVSVTFNPVHYDPARDEVVVAYRQQLEITFSGTNLKNAAPRPRRFIPESFDLMYRQTVLNYTSAKGAVGPGKYLVICADNSTVIANLDPLLEWRLKQGYEVQLATLSETGSSTSSIKSFIQGVYDSGPNPLEFVVLAGDATGTLGVVTWQEGLSGYSGEGDHYYTTLAGSDILADVHVGRLSFRDTSELSTIVSKIVDYETAPYMGDPGWFQRAALVGDPGSSGASCIHTNQQIKSDLLSLGYTAVDTVWSGNTSLIMTNYNKGGTIHTYRGYWGMSGVTTGHIDGMSNGEMLSFAVIPTCDTGSFRQDTHARSEAFLRAPNGGGVACIGMATIGTKTRENNCMFLGFLDGVLNSGDWRVGPALTRGKLEMYNNYIDNDPNHAETWMVWYNLMGDPATEIWTSSPKDLFVSHPTSLAVGAGAVTITVEGTGSVPIEGARVAIYKKSQISAVGYTDASGEVTLPLDSHTAGTLRVTALYHNFVPYQGTVTMGSEPTFVTYTSHTLDDDNSGASSGNNDGQLNPGETCELPVQVTNLGTGTAYGVSGTLTSTDPYVSISDGSEGFGDIGSGASAWSTGSYVFGLAANAPEAHLVEFELLLTDGGDSWVSLVEIMVRAAAGQAESYTWGGAGATLDPGESGTLSIEIRNVGSLSIGSATATLTTESPWISISDASGTYGAIGPGGTGENSGDPFSITVDGACFQGYLATFEMILDFASGAQDTVVFQTTVGTVSSDDPVGPDQYGYYIFDNTDTSYSEAPVYSWVEIDPIYGGSGTSVGLSDTGYENDDTRPVDLPFTFSFYGEPYNKISVCSNGWIAMGVTDIKLWYNKTLPGSGGPGRMIAGFWDDLYIPGGGDVCYWYDTANNRFVIEYSRVRLEANNNTETFEIILYDPEHYPTESGDGIIVCQYNTVSNTDSWDGYATVGMQNQDRNDGLVYTYWNDYAAGAATLASGRAISIVPVSPQAQGYLEGDVTNVTGGGSSIEGASVRVVEAARTLTTQADGHYYGSVPGGTYLVIASHESFAPDTTSGVTVVEGQTTVQDFALTDILGPYILNTTDYPDTDDTVGPYVIQTNITDYSAVAETRFYYTSSTSGGPHEVTLTSIDPPTGLYQAEIPGQATGSVVQYWVTATDIADNESADPAGAPFSTYVFIVGVITIFDDDMESDQGWTVGAAGDDASAGIWERVDPNGVWDGGTEVQPEDDATPNPGIRCYITGNDPPGSPQGTDDVDGGKTTLVSPVFNLSGYVNAVVEYKRWYTNDTGFSPGEDYWVVEVSDNGSTWVALENTNVSERSWLTQSFVLSPTIDMTSTVQFRFVASDEGSGSVVEAGVDDFLLTGYTVSGDDTESPVVTVTVPNGGEVFLSGQSYAIEWTATDDIGVVMTHVILSTDGGSSFPDTLVSGALGGSWDWTVPDLSEPDCRIKVVCLDAAQNQGSDVSDADFTISNVSGVEDTPAAHFALAQNRPNPFNPRTQIEFGLPREQRITLRVYDVEGRLVRTLAQGVHPAGRHSVAWDGTDGRGARVSSGLYFYRLTTLQKTITRKMMLLK